MPRAASLKGVIGPDLPPAARRAGFADSIMPFGAALLISVLPFVILLSSLANHRIDTDLSRHTGLNRQGAVIVSQLFRPSPAHSAAALSGWGHFNDDTWELYHTDVDRAEVHDLAAEQPEKLRELVNLWFAEAGANGAFPLDDRSALELILTPRPQLAAPRNRYIYFPDTADVPEQQAVNIRNRSYVIGALVDIPAPGAQGAMFAHGARFGGHSLYVKDNRLHYVYNFVGLFEQKIDATEDLPVGENLILSASFDKDGEDPPGVATGILSLYHGDTKVGEGRIKTQPGLFEPTGEGLCVGRDSGAAVTDDYAGRSPHRFTGGTIKRVVVDVSGEPYIDLEREAAAMLARE
jgi:arylsulfatase